MTKYKYIFIPALCFLPAILGWQMSGLYTDLASLLSNINAGPKLRMDSTQSDEAKNMNEPILVAHNNNIGHYEKIEETIARIKRDVIVTGTIVNTIGEESALFQIESMPDRSFQINKQLMDGFIITEITKNHVVLKNQIGNETFSLRVQSGTT